MLLFSTLVDLLDMNGLGELVRMGLGVEDPLVQADEAGIGEHQVRVLQGLSKEETLLEVGQSRVAGIIDIIQAGEATICTAVLVDSRENSPSLVLPCGLTSQTVEIEQTFQGFCFRR